MKGDKKKVRKQHAPAVHKPPPSPDDDDKREGARARQQDTAHESEEDRSVDSFSSRPGAVAVGGPDNGNDGVNNQDDDVDPENPSPSPLVQAELAPDMDKAVAEALRKEQERHQQELADVLQQERDIALIVHAEKLQTETPSDVDGNPNRKKYMIVLCLLILVAVGVGVGVGAGAESLLLSAKVFSWRFVSSLPSSSRLAALSAIFSSVVLLAIT